MFSLYSPFSSLFPSSLLFSSSSFLFSSNFENNKFSTLSSSLLLNKNTNTNKEDEVLFSTKNKTQLICFNRPKKHNALNINMIKSMKKVCSEINELENPIKQIIFKGSGDKSFCSGGDIKNICLTKDTEFFKEEYDFLKIIGSKDFLKTKISILDGISMGCGLSIAFQSDIRIATERSILQIPEVCIGAWIDGGVSKFLTEKLDNHIGWYFGLTGFTIKSLDLLKYGFATHFIPSNKLSELENNLINFETNYPKNKDKYTYFKEISREIEKIEPEMNNPGFSNYLYQQIPKNQLYLFNYIFTLNKIEEAIFKLKLESKCSDKERSEFAKMLLKRFHSLSPTSLKVNWEILKRQERKPMSLNKTLDLELNLMKKMVTRCYDFREGVRATLIDKDKNYNWFPTDFESIGTNLVNSYFSNKK